MSLLSPDHVIVGLSPYCLSALHVKGGLQRHIVETHDQPLGSSSDATHWEDSIKALEVLLTTKNWGSGQIAVVLSNHWTHFALVPGKRRLGAAEQEALATIVFDKTYGQISLTWEIRTSPASREGTMVASGIPKALIQAIRIACGKRLRSIRPLLMPVANTINRSIRNDTGRLIIAETGRVTFASIRNGQWQSIYSRATPVSNEFVSLKKILDEDRILQEQSTNELLWFCNITGKFRIPEAGEGFTRIIEPKILAGEDGKYVPSLAYWGIHQ